MNNNPFENAMEQLQKASGFLEIRNPKPETRREIAQKIEILKSPQRILNVTIPIAMDDGSI
jgi:hypothetical protein